MKRRTFLATSVMAGVGLLDGQAQAQRPVINQQQKLGLVLLHGKLDRVDGALEPVARAGRQLGFDSEYPNLPWSSSRYLSANWDNAMVQASQAINTVRAQGARRVVLVGHGIGCVLAMNVVAFSQSGRSGAITSLVLLAPGHAPQDYYDREPPVRESVDRARAMVTAGDGLKEARFFDSDDGRPLAATMAAVNYLSFLDPRGQAQMAPTLERVTMPVLWVSGGQENTYRSMREATETLKGNFRSKFEVMAGVSPSDIPSRAVPLISRWLESL